MNSSYVNELKIGVLVFFVVFRKNLSGDHRSLFVLLRIHLPTVPTKREIHPKQQPGEEMQEYQKGCDKADLHLFGKHQGSPIHQRLHSSPSEHFG